MALLPRPWATRKGSKWVSFTKEDIDMKSRHNGRFERGPNNKIRRNNKWEYRIRIGER